MAACDLVIFQFEMPTFPINSFKFGLDTRRDVLTSLPGTLVSCENCHINPGGEIEKRKAFGDFAANTEVLDSNGAIGVFGIEVTDVGLVVFGSALNFGASVSQSQPTLASAVVGVTYQQLKHPSLVNDATETYNATYHRMTAIVFSENFNGKAFACAQFSDGRRFLYYDGALIQQSANGVVMEGRIAVTDLSNDLDRQVEFIGWISDANVDENAVAQDGSTIIKSPQSDYFTPLLSDTSIIGYVGVNLLDQNGAALNGTRATASFEVTGNSGTFKLEAPSQPTATTPTINLCGGLVAAAGSAILTATAIARAVNDFTSVHGYSAVTNTLTSVFVYAPIGYDISVALDLTVTTTTGTVGAAGASPSALAAIAVPSPLVVVRETISPFQNNVAGSATIQVAGGTSPYTFAWSEAVSGSGGGIQPPIGSVGPTGTFFARVFPNTTLNGSFKCEVRDAASGLYTVFLNVSLTNRQI